MEKINELWNLMYEESEGMVSVLVCSTPSSSCIEAEEKGEEFLTKLNSFIEKNTITEAEKKSLVFLALSVMRDIHNRPEEYISDFIDELFLSIGDIIDEEIEKCFNY